MPAKIRVVRMRQKVERQGKPGVAVINCCINNPNRWESALSPFRLGPCELWGDNWAVIMENAWQFSKVYECHADKDGNPTEEWHEWARYGWDSTRAHRYPMGKGAVPLYSLWDEQRLGYIDARKQIYAPLYLKLVRETEGYRKLRGIVETHDEVYLRDFDGYDYAALEMDLTEVLNDPFRICGHAHVLAMDLTKDPALEQINI